MNILLAEDEKQLSRALVTAMQATGYHVDPAYNGQEAVDLAGATGLRRDHLRHHDAQVKRDRGPKAASPNR